MDAMDQVRAWEQQLAVHGKDFDGISETVHLVRQNYGETPYTRRNSDILWRIYESLDERRHPASEERAGLASEAVKLWEALIVPLVEKGRHCRPPENPEFTSLNARIIFRPYQDGEAIELGDDETVTLHFCDANRCTRSQYDKTRRDCNKVYLSELANELGIPVKILKMNTVQFDGIQYQTRCQTAGCLGGCSDGPKVAITLHDSTVAKGVRSVSHLKELIAEHIQKTKHGGV